MLSDSFLGFRRRPGGAVPSLVLTALLLSGCAMTDDDSTKFPVGGASGVPEAGTATTDDAVDSVRDVSGRIAEFIGVPGKMSEPGPGVKECPGRDPDTYFQVYHPWNFKPDSGGDIDVAMENLKEKLNTDGWVIKQSYRDNSANRNLNLVADDDYRKMSVWVVAYGERATPSLGVEVISGCYRAPEGETVRHS